MHQSTASSSSSDGEQRPRSRPSPSLRKRRFHEHADRLAESRDHRVARNAYYYRQDHERLASVIPAGSEVLDLGCGTGSLLGALQPSRGVGVDFSAEMIARSREKFPAYEFVLGDVEDEDVLEEIEGTFDAIVLADTLGFVDDCSELLRSLQRFCRRDTRIVIAQYSPLWEPILVVAEKVGLKTEQPELNWLSTGDIEALCHLADLEPVSVRFDQLCPKRLLGLGSLVNRLLASLPFLRRLCLRNYVVARSLPRRGYDRAISASVIIPCRNERENVEQAVLRTPRFAERQEIVFVEGHSQDGTWEEIQRVQRTHQEASIRSLQQPGKGKADAVRSAFEVASGDLLMILDGDLTVPPEDLPKFYRAIVEGQGEFVMGTRMVYPLERDAMRFLNYWANKSFALIFSWMLRQRVTDTLCGTKVISRAAYEELARTVELGAQDPFGDFDLIVGAAQQSLKITEIPVRYAARAYGETQISRFRHGLMLLRMVVYTFRRL